MADLERLKQAFHLFPNRSVMPLSADSLVGESVKDPLKYFNNNIKNSIQLLEIKEGHNAANVFFSSCADVSGEPKEIPITEEHPCNPMNP